MTFYKQKFTLFSISGINKEVKERIVIMDLKYKKGFSLTEVMIALTVIGIIAAILLPVGINSIPNENILKFKKANNALITVVKNLINSDEYFLAGDLSKKPDGTDAGSLDLYNGFADTLSYKDTRSTNTGSASLGYTIENLISSRSLIDNSCSLFISNYGPRYITTTDNITWFFPLDTMSNNSKKHFLVCVDVDGVPSGVQTLDCINECPFGYLIREDGKIIHGQRALDWLNKNIQDKE